ncbi:MAG TPA: hypothetical protein VMU78_07290 [Methylocella sp.]|nr:hypothetical protein [Methylocella sp.]
MNLYTALDAFRNWDGFRLEPAKVTGSSNIFGIGEFISTLALLVIVVTVSDFRYRYRFAVRRLNVRTLGIGVATIIGLFLIVTEVWFQNSLPIFRFINNYSNLKIVLAAAFIVLVLYVVATCFMRPQKFQRSNAKQFFEATAHLIHQGNADRLQVVAEELSFSIARIFERAAKIPNGDGAVQRMLPPEQGYARSLLLLIADRRFCHLIVDRVPGFAIQCFELAAKYPNIPFAQFSRNVGEEFITNETSAFYQEDSGFQSGFFGYLKPITTTVFGSYKLVERCASKNACPLDISYKWLDTFDEKQMEGFSRAALAFFDSYLQEDKGQTHSFAFARLINSFKNSLRGTYKLKGASGDYWKTPEYHHLAITAEFVHDAINSLDKHAIRPNGLRRKKVGRHYDTFDSFADLIFEMILATSHVSEPDWTCWHIQHNTVWSSLFTSSRSNASSIILFKLRRLIYDEIKKMDKFVNFKGAGFLGYCLNVLGLTLVDRHKGFGREHYPLHAVVLSWTKRNYRRLVTDHPKVAERCLQGSVAYDRENHRLFKSFANDTRKEPGVELFNLD